MEKGGTGIEELSACCCAVIYPISALVKKITLKKVNSGNQIPEEAEAGYSLHQKLIERKLKVKYYLYPMVKNT